MNVGQLIYLLMGIPRYFDVVIDGEGGNPAGVEMDTFNALAIIKVEDDATVEEDPSSDRDDDPAGMAGYPYV